MNNEKDKILDDLFRKHLKDPVDETGYKEENWDALEQMLDHHKKRKGIVYWLPVLSSVAALLLLFLGWWAFRKPVINHNSKSNLHVVNHHPQVNEEANNSASKGINNESDKEANNTANGRSAKQHDQKLSNTTNYANNYKNSNGRSMNKPVFNVNTPGSRITIPGSLYVVGNNKAEEKNTLNNNMNEALVAENPSPVFEPWPITSGTVTLANLQKNSANTSKGNKNSKTRLSTIGKYKPQYALTVLAAPDINGVGSFQQSKVGTNIGMQFSVGITKKLTITTGAIYSAKPYTEAFGNYHTDYQFKETPLNVTADCRMIDVPINIGYQVYNKHQNKIALGTGLSSYIMLHESYKFNYTDPYTSGPSAYTVPHSGTYFLGVLNLHATYDHQINSKVAIEIQPYLKLPLTNIGYSQVRLQTTGIAVGLHWNINSSSKP